MPIQMLQRVRLYVPHSVQANSTLHWLHQRFPKTTTLLVVLLTGLSLQLQRHRSSTTAIRMCMTTQYLLSLFLPLRATLGLPLVMTRLVMLLLLATGANSLATQQVMVRAVHQVCSSHATKSVTMAHSR